MPKKIAIFDFDHTLITGDSFWPFMIYSCGRFATYAALGEAVFRLAQSHIKKEKTEGWRTFIKGFLLHRLLAGKSRDSLRNAAAKTREWQVKNSQVMRALREHHDNGDVIVIASGGLDLYLPESLRDMPYDVLICTEIGVENGIVTGEMIRGNCVRLRKAELVASWLAANGPFDEESWGYGNYPHDLPMLELVKHRVIVS